MLDVLRLAVAFSDELNIVLSRFDATLGLLLKGMEHVDAAGEPHCIHGSIRVALEVVHDLQHAGTAESFERFGVRMLVSDLCKIEGKAHRILHVRGKVPQVVSRRTDPDDWLEVFAHVCYYARTGIDCRGKPAVDFSVRLARGGYSIPVN